MRRVGWGDPYVPVEFAVFELTVQGGASVVCWRRNDLHLGNSLLIAVTRGISSGMRTVMRRKLLARMRSRYSRLAMSQILCIDILSYGFDEDLLERGLHDFEAGDSRATLGGRGKEWLSVGSRAVYTAELDLLLTTIVLRAFNAGMREKGI